MSSAATGSTSSAGLLGEGADGQFPFEVLADGPGPGPTHTEKVRALTPWTITGKAQSLHSSDFISNSTYVY